MSIMMSNFWIVWAHHVQRHSTLLWAFIQFPKFFVWPTLKLSRLRRNPNMNCFIFCKMCRPWVVLDCLKEKKRKKNTSCRFEQGENLRKDICLTSLLPIHFSNVLLKLNKIHFKYSYHSNRFYCMLILMLLLVTHELLYIRVKKHIWILRKVSRDVLGIFGNAWQLTTVLKTKSLPCFSLRTKSSVCSFTHPTAKTAYNYSSIA